MRNAMTSDAAKWPAASALFGLLAATTAAQAKNAQADPRAQPTFTRAQLAERTLHRRAVEAVIWGMPAVNAELMFQAMKDAKLTSTRSSTGRAPPASRKNQTHTPNPDTIYLMPFSNTKDVGPMVLQIVGAVLGVLQVALAVELILRALKIFGVLSG